MSRPRRTRSRPGATATSRSNGLRPATSQRPRLGVPIGNESLLDGPRDRDSKEPLDAPEEIRLVDRDEADRIAREAGSAGPADPVDVVLGVPWQLEVDDVGEILDVEAACRDVRRDEDADLAGLELLEGPCPLRL